VWNLYATRYWRIGGSFGLVIPKPLREGLGFTHGDLLLIAKRGHALIIWKPTPGTVVDRGELDIADGHLPGLAEALRE
jgi:bifunctional DNA-binding transcriptional regulator/antitoxin component of YhaV-PrlF toxin-antitoxin module